MKKILLLLFVGLNIFLCGTNASTIQKHMSEDVSNQVVIILDLEYGNWNENLSTRLEEAFNLVNVSSDSTEDIQCSITVKVKISAGVVSGEASVTVSGPCDEVEAEVERITAQCIKKAEKALQEAL
ncbi:MAG: hypothetical protein IJ413_07675 [Bacteroides sp.]|nr:hypothetical protein [Bacteroides sp.]